jgi:hypothetical protein
MKRSKRKVLSVIMVPVFLFLAIASPEAASDDRGRGIGGVKLGAMFPQYDDVEGESKGFALELAGGYQFLRNVSAELGIGYFSTDVPVYTAFGSRYKTPLFVYEFPLTVKFRHRFGNFEPYLGGGIGWYYADLVSEEGGSGPKSDWGQGHHFSVGFNVGAFGVEARYISTEVDLLNVKNFNIEGYLLFLTLGR